MRDVTILTLLRTTYIPSQLELERIRETIFGKDAALTLVERSIARLSSRRDDIAASLKLHEALASPARRIPSEIWSEIFVYCLLGDWRAPPSPYQAPLLLCRICSVWRQIAISTPQLWSSLSLSGYRRFDSRVGVALTWISRSGTLPLYLELDRHAFPEARIRHEWVKEQEALQAMFTDSLIASASRWKHLVLDISTDSKSIFLNTPHVSLSLLERLDLTILPGNLDDRFTMTDAPRLRVVTIHLTVIYSIDKFRFNLPWAQLTSFSAHRSSISRCQEFLQGCSSLQSIHIEACIVKISSAPPVLLPYLHTLELLNCNDDTQSLLNVLILPRLRSVTLDAWDADHSRLLSLLSRSFCRLGKLSLFKPRRLPALHLPVPSEDSLIELVHQVPSLLRLAVMEGEKNIVMDRVTTAVRRNRLDALAPVAPE